MVIDSKVGQEFGSIEGEEAFGMELDTFERLGLMPDSHDFVLVGPGEIKKESGSVPGLITDAVIAGRFQTDWVGRERSFGVVMNLRGLCRA